MDDQSQINYQRVKYIIESYTLEGQDGDSFWTFLDELLGTYPAPLVELAIAETIATNWLQVPMPRGIDCLVQIQSLLKTWETPPIVSRLTPSSFRDITGLDPAPILALPDVSLPKSPAQSP